ncbi:MAG: DUF423 domain-containing protein [Verrucomicrobiales bacterium]
MEKSALPPLWLRLIALSGFLGVALGAFGAHGLKDYFTAHPTHAEWWQKASLYHLTHTVAALGALALGARRLPIVLFLFGILIFSGTLYLMALTNERWLGAITPIGGTALLAGWLALAFMPSPARRGDGD